MDHLAPSTGVSWYNYNPFGEMLGGTQLPPMELGGLDVSRQIASHVYAAAPEGTLSNGMHYALDGQNTTVEMIHVPHQDQAVFPLAETKAANRVRTAFGEKIACQECGATFACGANLRNHLRIHSGERPFICEECGASFTQSSNLRTHKRVHTGERPYMCGICGQTFARSSHLPGHMRTHTGERPFSCPHCGRSFATNQIMKNHLRTHTGERPFVCEVCGATFAQSSCLATHKKIHTGERNYRCRECGKAFISRSGLQTHERVHTGEKPFGCEKCDKSFKTSSYLSKHRQKYCGNNGYKNKGDHPSSLKKAPKKPSKVRKEAGNADTQAKAATKFSKRLLIKRLRRSHKLRTGDSDDKADEGGSRVDENGALLSTKVEESEVKTEAVEALGSNLDGLNNGVEPAPFQDCRSQENQDHLEPAPFQDCRSQENQDPLEPAPFQDCRSQENQDPLDLPCRKERHYSDGGCSNSLSNIKLADPCQMVTHASYAVEDQVSGLQEEFLHSAEFSPDENLQFSVSQGVDEKQQHLFKTKCVLEGPWCSMSQS